MKQISSIAANLLADIPVLTNSNSGAVDSVAANARGALAQIGELLNSQYGGVFVFAVGSGLGESPIAQSGPNHITLGFYLRISARSHDGLSANGAAATAATTLAIASSTTVGTSPLSTTYLAQSAAGLTPPWWLPETWTVATAGGHRWRARSILVRFLDGNFDHRFLYARPDASGVA